MTFSGGRKKRDFQSALGADRRLVHFASTSTFQTCSVPVESAPSAQMKKWLANNPFAFQFNRARNARSILPLASVDRPQPVSCRRTANRRERGATQRGRISNKSQHFYAKRSPYEINDYPIMVRFEAMLAHSPVSPTSLFRLNWANSNLWP